MGMGEPSEAAMTRNVDGAARLEIWGRPQWSDFRICHEFRIPDSRGISRLSTVPVHHGQYFKIGTESRWRNEVIFIFVDNWIPWSFYDVTMVTVSPSSR